MSASNLRVLQPFVGAGGITFKNRVVMAPLTRARADVTTGCVLPIHAKYYADRSSGAVIISEGAGISRQGLGWFGAPGIYTEEQVEAWKGVTSAVHAANGLIYCQLWHMGRAGHSDVYGSQPVSASALAPEGEVTACHGEKKPFEIPRALTVEEIRATVQDYVKAAKNAMAAGFDGVQLHGANGYLVDQFLQSISNIRTDEFGGSVENRTRFLREVLEGIVSVVPRERVWVRFAPNGSFNSMGSEDNLETFDAAIRVAAELKLGGVEILDGLAFGFHKKAEPYTLERARAVIRAANPEGTTALCGGCGYTLEEAEKQLEAGNADFIAWGRSYMSNPDLPERFRDGAELAAFPDYADWWTAGRGEQGFNTFPKHN